MSNARTRTLIMGAAGRDFHNFNVWWKNQPGIEVVCFTAAQIPDIDGRVYPAVLAGKSYPDGIPIHSETRLDELIREYDVDLVTFAYSDVSYAYVMREAARVNAAGAQFVLLGADQTMLPSTKPVIAVGAVRTGCGKSQTSRRVARILKGMGYRVAVVRHPMPYGDLTRQICQRFASIKDMDDQRCTIEEREEYEPHVAMGNLVFAGVDYELILRRAETEADVILWDGGNNDLPFFRPDLNIVVADPHRPGHEIAYYPGETNLRMADVVIVNKVDTAAPEHIATVEANIRAANPRATLLRANSPVTVREPDRVRGKRVLVIEDGPTLTHGEMRYGAGLVAARQLKAAEIVDPRPYACGSIKGVFERYPHLTQVLPAMGYGERQIAELSETIAAVPCDVVLIATPIDLAHVLKLDKPSTRVTYELEEHDKAALPKAIAGAIERRARGEGDRSEVGHGAR
ncbi:MAG TPA: cyclic 2,3-diphosphoglycerate synthase [Dongiaceae bacterium]|nr:cyclic 2,3-diphosphoglycerate synthase [Dongiaceae bacterium]